MQNQFQKKDLFDDICIFLIREYRLEEIVFSIEEEDKMEADAEEPDTELQLQYYPSASSRDHEVSEDPPKDNVREGTSPGKQDQTMEQDSNSVSVSLLLSTFRSTIIMPYRLKIIY